MRKMLARMPSPAMAVAFVALLAALTGTAVALPGSNTVTGGDLVRNSVGKSEIKAGAVGKSEAGAGSIGASEVRNNSLGGSDINEGGLGTVPSSNAANFARSAGFAGAAANAGATNGVSAQKINYQAAEDTGPQTILNFGGLTLTAECETGPNLLIIANPSSSAFNGGILYSYELNPSTDDFNVGDDEVVVDGYGTPYAGALHFRAGNGTVNVTELVVDDDNTDNICKVGGISNAG